MTRARAYAPTWQAFSTRPINWAITGFVLLAFVGLWTSSAKLLVSSGWRGDGRVLSCVYFTGSRVVEWQYLDTVPDIERFTCPAVKFG